MSDSRHYDVVIVGSGAGGGTLAHALASSGKSILILERGEHLPREAENWDAHAVFVERRYRTSERWFDKNGHAFVPNTHYWVGGNTSFYGAALMRLRRGDFEERRHAGGISPAWPISYDDMAPWYDKAEAFWQVHGECGGDPTEEPGEPSYPFPAIEDDPGIADLRRHLTGLGWRPFRLPLGIQRDDARPLRSTCIRCLTCGGYPCLLRAKSDARSLCIEPILDLPNVRLLTGHKAVRVETAEGGKRAKTVICETAEGESSFTGDIIVLAAGAANTVALMLASANGDHPDGLANGSGQVGRNYMFHTLTAMVSLTPSPVAIRFPKTLGVNDFYWGEPDGSYDLPMGHIQLLEYMSGQTLEGQIADMLPPRFVPDRLTNSLARHMLSLLVLSEDLPDKNNRVRLDRQGHIILEYSHGEMSAHQRLVARLDDALDRFTDVRHPLSQHHFQLHSLLPLYGTAHQCGTVRFGNDRRSSVLDASCKAHEIDNLYVVDSSFFVSSAAVNPTLTIVANALRVAEHLKERLGA